MPHVYRKTAKGQREIETRADRLPPRVRTALILVDGQRDDAELRKLAPGDAGEALRQLLDSGYIEQIEVVEPTAASAAPASNWPPSTRPAPFAPSTRPSPFAPSSWFSRPTESAGLGADHRAFDLHRRAAVRVLNEHAGPMGEAVAIRLEKARSWDELLPVLQLAQRAIANVSGEAAAADFARRFIENPPA